MSLSPEQTAKLQDLIAWHERQALHSVDVSGSERVRAGRTQFHVNAAALCRALSTSRRDVTRAEFDMACDALWSELQYQNDLPRRSPTDEAKDVPGFLTLGRRYLREVENAWADNYCNTQTLQVEEAVHGLRKLAAIFVRGMIYNGIRRRKGY